MSWKAIPTQTTWSIVPPQHGEKRMRCPSEFEGSSFHPVHMSSMKRFFLSHMTVCVVACRFARFIW